MKNTKRKGFNFFRSYFDVFNELPEKDKLPFIEALLNKQFLGIDPENLKGMAKFAYISQQHSISEQVKGFESKTGIILTPTEGGSDTPTEQVEVKEEVKEEVKVKEEYTPNFNEAGKSELYYNWLEYRKQIKKPIKAESTLKGLVKKFNEKSFDELNFVVNASIENGWQGLIWEKYSPGDKPKTLKSQFDHLLTEEERNGIS